MQHIITKDLQSIVCVVVSSACLPAVFTVLGDTSVPGGSPKTLITTLEQCQSQCAANIACMAMDWDATARKTRCWFHLNSVGQRRNTTGVVHYVISDRCPRSE